MLAVPDDTPGVIITRRFLTESGEIIYKIIIRALNIRKGVLQKNYFLVPSQYFWNTTTEYSRIFLQGSQRNMRQTSVQSLLINNSDIINRAVIRENNEN